MAAVLKASGFTHCTANFANGDTLTGDLIITADEGYYFQQQRSYYARDPGFKIVNFEFVDAGQTQLRSLSGDWETYGTIQVPAIIADEGSLPVTGPTFTMSGEMEHATCNYADGEALDNAKTVTITADSGYQFAAVKSYSYRDGHTGQTRYFTQSSDHTQLTIAPPYNGDIDADDFYRASEIPAPVTHVIHITGSIANAVCNYADGDTLNDTKRVEITANEGYSFTETYTYFVPRLAQTLNMGKTPDNKTLYITGPFDEDIQLNDDYTATRDVVHIGQFVNLYTVTGDELAALSKVRFNTVSGGSNETIDYGQYITALYVLPLSIPADIIGDRANIQLGDYDSEVESTQLLNYTFSVDAGSVSVPSKYNNAYDYLNTACTLYIPFVGPVELDPDVVIGRTVSVGFSIDLYSGTLTYSVKSTFNGEQVTQSGNVNIVTQIPFIQSQTRGIVNNLSAVNKYFTDHIRIEVTRNIPYYAEGSVFGKPVIQYMRIGDISGYAEFSEIQLVTSATDEERDDIVSLLNGGVFINGNP